MVTAASTVSGLPASVIAQAQANATAPNYNGVTAGSDLASIGSRAMLVDLTIKKWAARAKDKKVSAQVAEDNGSDPTMGSYSKLLLAKDALKEINEIATSLYAEHIRRTLPWLDNGARMLSASGYFEYSALVAAAEVKWDAAVARFIANYDSYHNAAIVSLGLLYDPNDYPEAAQLRKKFAIGYNVFPIPDAQDERLRAAVGADEAEKIAIKITEAQNSAYAAAVQTVYERIADVISHMSEKLRAYTVTADGTTGVFRDSLVDNVKDLVGILPTLNVTGDPMITEITARLETELCAVPAVDLRVNSRARTRVADSADAILAQMQGLFGAAAGGRS